MNTELNEKANQYAERVCSGEFPITYSREQCVKHTANDFMAGYVEATESNKQEWFKAGGMAERILIDWEMKQLKERYQHTLKSNEHLMQELKEAKSELDIKQGKVIALGERIKMLMESKKADSSTKVSVGKKLKKDEAETDHSAAFCQCNVSGALPDERLSAAWTWLAKRGTVYGGIEHGDCFKAIDVLRALQMVNRANCR